MTRSINTIGTFWLLLLGIVVIIINSTEAVYVPPPATVEPLKPAGIRISIPHEEGISLVAFHVKFNEDFEGLEAGTIARDIIKPKNGRWTYQDKSTKLKNNDVIYYWIHVVYNGLGYNMVDQQHVVTDFYSYEGQQQQQQHTTSKPIYIEDDVQTSGKGCKSSATRVYDDSSSSNYRQPCIGDILLDENFSNGNQFNRSEWTVVEQFAGAPDYEFVVYRNSRENVVVDNGLKIVPKFMSSEYGDYFLKSGSLSLDRCTGKPGTMECQRSARGWNILPPISSGRLNTNKFLNFMYGRVEIKARLPRGDWLYPLLLLQSAKGNSEAQIRIASSSGNADLKTRQGYDISGHTLWGGIVNLNSEQQQQQVDNRFSQERTVKRNNELWSRDYHIYELLWSPGRIVLKVDGEKYDERAVDLPRDLPFFLTIGVAAGGIAEFPDYSTSYDYGKTWRNSEAKAAYTFYNTSDLWSKTWDPDSIKMEVEYVRVWAL